MRSAAIWGPELALAGQEVTLIARGARPGGDPRARPDPGLRRRSPRDRDARAGHQRYARAGQQDVVIAAVRPSSCCDCRRYGRPLWLRYDRCHGAERRALVVLPPARRFGVGGSVGRAGGTIRAYLPVGRVIGCGLPGGRASRARCRAAYRGRPLHDRRAGRRKDRASPAALEGARRRFGLKAPVRPRIRAEIWSQAVGQPGLLADQRPDPRCLM